MSQPRRTLGKPLAAATLFLLAFTTGLGSPGRAVEPPSYNRDIQPILADNCFACHGAESESREADLRLDQRDAAIEFAAITPGRPDESEVIARIFSDDPELQMPPLETKKKLTAAQKEQLKQWIAAGAEYQSHWSLIKPQRPQLPLAKNEAWVKNEIDRFVGAKLEANGLSPAPEADARTLFRRLHLDITGLPPSSEDLAGFAGEYAQRPDNALSEWIDRLMETSAWGEHRARYWLDAARYGDTHGLHFDNYREMWPYRDWVIRTFNANLPFDQFAVEQLAGDLLPDPTDDQLIATGFQRCNVTTNEGGTIPEENLANYAADRVQTFGWVFLSLTTNCGQCHDHKFDSFTMKDYYSLAAFFRNTTQAAMDGNMKEGQGPVLTVPVAEDRSRWKALPGEIAAAAARRDQHRKDARGPFEQWLTSATANSLENSAEEKDFVVHVPLNDGAGNEANNLRESPNSFRSTGEVTWVPDGKFGPSAVMKLGGTFDLGALGDFEKDQRFSYGAWIKAGRNDVLGGIIARMDEQGGYRGWDLWQNDRALAVHMIDSWPENAIKVSTVRHVIQPGQWQHVFVTFDGSGTPGGIKIYVDGKEEKLNVDKNSLKPDASIRTQTALRIGQRSHSQVFDGGAIQDVRVYRRTLSADEVQMVRNTATLQTILTTTTNQWTPQQQTAFFDHYLVTHDTDFPMLEKAIVDLEAERDAIKKRSPVTHIQMEKKDSSAMAFILLRGTYDKPGEKVEAATPAALHPLPAGAPKNRLGLAKWVVDPANPLTARVTVNRFWQEVFGQGIVTTPEDFGVMGALPSHPELLDWLAVEFRETGWDVKRLFKLMLTSATYRQAAVTTSEKLEKDRDNFLFSRGPRFRMDAEMVRDYALAVSDTLSPKMYGPGTKPYQPVDIWNMVGLPEGNTRDYVQDKGENLYRRTIYTFWKRKSPPPNLSVFNAPSREVCTIRRERTNTPLQALVTLNDPQFIEAARHLAQNALNTSGGDEAKAFDYVGQRVLGRNLNAKELPVVATNKKQLLAYYQSKPEDAKALIAVGASKVDEKLDRAKLAAWTMICNQIMNLDEVLNK